MIWTIIFLVVAVVLFIGVGACLHQDGKTFSAVKHIAKRVLEIVAIALLVIGINRCGLGTHYYVTQGNPNMLQEMADAMQSQKTAGASKEIKKYLKGHADEMAKNAPIIGDPEAKKTIFLFSAASCGYCRRVHGELARVVADYPDVRVVVKNFSIHGVMSDYPAKATIAAKMQGNDKAAALDEMIMTQEYYDQNDMQGKSQEDVAKIIKKNILAMAEKVGLDIKKLDEDTESSTVRSELAQVRDLANQFQIGGTPFLIIGDQAFPGAIPYDQIVQALK